MREFLGNILLNLSEKVLGRKACRIYGRRGYDGYRPDGFRGNSPFLREASLREFTYYNLVQNKYPYKGFSEHYLIVPKREIEKILELTEEEQKELISLIGEYENRGYIIVSQQFGVSGNGSISHKHVHLLK